MPRVTLRIVGLFFNESFEMPLPVGTTVKNVVDFFINQNPGKLTYVPQPNKPSPLSFTHDFNGSFNFDSFPGASPNDGPTLGKNHRQAGTYTLSEDVLSSPDVFLTWQYYVETKGGKLKSKTPANRGFKLWGSPPDYRINDGDVITWRLVAIYNAPVLKKS